MAGAEFHTVRNCQHQWFIKEALFSFFTDASDDLKGFVKGNLGVHPWEQGMEAFQAWLREHPGTDAPNPVKLYWWILKYWERLPE